MSDHMLTIVCGDACDELASLPEGSIPLIVTSPPYDRLRTYDGHSDFDFILLAHQMFRVLCDGGVLCWNVGDGVVNGSETLTAFKQAVFFVEQCGFRMHDTMIYEKLNFSHPEKTRYHQMFEYVFILSKGAPRTFNPIVDKVNATAGCIGNLGVNTFTEADGSKSVRDKKVTAEFGMRGNVWRGKTRGQEDMCEALPHPAMMPKWLARDLILSWSNLGETVLDPMAGSGTVGKKALETGRRAYLIDKNQAYIDVIRQETNITPALAL